LEDFLPLLNAASALGMIRQSARESPFATSAPTVTSTAAAFWTGEGLAKPASSFTLAGTTLPPRKLVSFVVISRELAELATPAAERMVRQVLLDAITRGSDGALFDPTLTATDDRPASLTNGLSATSATGAMPDAIRADLAALADAITADMVAPLWVMRPASALRLALAGITSDNGQTIGGAPIHRSIGVPEGVVVLLDLSALAYAGGSDLIADASEQASLQWPMIRPRPQRTPFHCFRATSSRSGWNCRSTSRLARDQSRSLLTRSGNDGREAHSIDSAATG
jgi:hypothetical protein